jgi:hypothetical protein
MHDFLTSPTYVDVRHDFFRLCVFIAANALMCNFLPDSERLDRFPKLQWIYEILISLVAGFGLNWRHCLPSLDLEIMGFKVKRVK